MAELLFQILASEIADWKRTCETDESIDWATVQVALGSLITRARSAGLLDPQESETLRSDLGFDD